MRNELTDRPVTGTHPWVRVTKRVAFYVVAVIAALPFLFPLWWMVTSSLKPAHEVFATPPTLFPLDIKWSNYVDVFTVGPFGRQIVNSVYIAALNVGGTLLFASLAGYAFARIRFPFRTPIFIALIAALFMPSEVTIIPLFRMMTAWGWVGTHLPLIVEPWFGGFAALAVFLMRQAFLSIPVELEEAAFIDGAGRWRIWWSVAMPLVRPALATLGVLAFIFSWNRFLEPLVYLNDINEFTVPLGLTQYVDSSGGTLWEIQLAATTISVIPIAIVFLFAQRYFIAGVAGTGIKG